MPSDIYREQAFKRDYPSHQLNQLIHVIKPSAWLILVGMGLFLTFLILWGFLGNTTTKVAGTGILIRSTGNRSIMSPANGQLDIINVKVGDSVRTGQIIGLISQPELKKKLEDLRQQYDELVAYYAILSHEHMKDSVTQTNNKATQHRSLKKKLENLENRLKSQLEREKNLENLANQGLVTKAQVFEIQQQIVATREEMEAVRWDESQLDVSLSESEFSKRTLLLDTWNEVLLAHANLSDAQLQFDKANKIVSDYTGTVLEVSVLPGSFVNAGIPVISIETLEKTVEALLFIPPNMADEIDKGMKVEIIPATVHVEEYGFIKGKVRFVSQFPVTSSGMMTLLDNPKLVEMLSAYGAPYRVDVELIKDPSTFSGYTWSSSSGPQHKLSTGTICTGNVIAREQPPITLVIPFMKKLIGI
jgi:HlyD family secretion protein